MIKIPNYNNIGELTVDRFDFQKHINGDSFNHFSENIKLEPTLFINNKEVFNLKDSINELNNIISNGLNIKKATVGNTLENLGTIRISGDISGTYNNISVIALSGTLINAGAVSPNTNDVLRWNGSSWMKSASLPNGVASGNLSGNYPNPQVTNLNMFSQTIGSILYKTNSNWTVLSPTSSNTILGSQGSGANVRYTSKDGYSPSGPAGGSFTGTYPNPTILDGSLSKTLLSPINSNSIIATTQTSTTMAAIKYGNGINYLNDSLVLDRSHYSSIEEHFLIDSFIYYKPTLILAGFTSYVAGSSTEFSSVVLSASANSMSGVNLKTTSTIRLMGGECFVCKFKITSNINITSIFGFYNGTVTSSRGAFFIVHSGGSITLQLRRDATSFTAPGSTVLNTSDYYTIELYVKENISGVYCKLYNSNGSLLEVLNINNGIDLTSDNLSSGVCSQISTVSPTFLLYVDYMATTKYLG